MLTESDCKIEHEAPSEHLLHVSQCVALSHSRLHTYAGDWFDGHVCSTSEEKRVLRWW